MKKSYLVLLLIFSLSFSWAEISQEREQQIKQEMQSFIHKIDYSHRQILNYRELVVTLYQQILERNPSWLEVFALESLLYGDQCSLGDNSCVVKIQPSHLVAVLLMQKEQTPQLSYEVLANNLPLLQSLDLTTPPRWEPNEKLLPKKETAFAPRKTTSFAITRNDGKYQVYHGYLHAHTSFSDGEGTPEEAYTMVRDQAGMDFFSVTDHSEMLALWPWEDKWQQLKDIAKKFHEDHRFVALHGFEWSSPIFGHINVLGTEEITNCVDDFLVKDMMEWIRKHPEAVTRFNHPGRDKFGMEFDHFKLYPENVEQMVAVEMFSKGTGIDSFVYNKGYFGKNNHLDDANLKGWRVGVVGGQDNHDKDWGLRNDFNVGVWATELTKEGILEAYRARRTFATEDRNLSLSFRLDGAEMGSVLRSGRQKLVITLADDDRENFEKVDLYQSGKLWKSYPLNSKQGKIEIELTTKAQDYYYCVVKQQDGDLALSSPIWIVE